MKKAIFVSFLIFATNPVLAQTALAQRGQERAIVKNNNQELFYDVEPEEEWFDVSEEEWPEIEGAQVLDLTDKDWDQIKEYLAQQIAQIEPEESKELVNPFAQTGEYLSGPFLPGVESAINKRAWVFAKIPTILGVLGNLGVINPAWGQIVDPAAFQVFMRWFVDSAQSKTKEDLEKAFQSMTFEAAAQGATGTIASAATTALGLTTLSSMPLSFVLYALIRYLQDGTDVYGVGSLYEYAKAAAQKAKSRFSRPEYAEQIYPM